MSAPTLKRLVVDASVARAAGGEKASDPTSKQCRDFLLAVYTICHRIVLTPEIDDEWKRHQSGFVRKWRRWMDGPKKIIRLDPELAYKELFARIERLAASDQDREAMEKDFCLIEAALTADQIVVSRDETVRGLFAQASQAVEEVKTVIWVNPNKAKEQPIAWLKDGAPADTKRQLGSWSEKE